jgi:type III restriction enzyme
MTTFLNRAPDIQSFCKNVGPQALKIDYLTGIQRLSLYTSDFIVKKKDGNYLLVETKGREDLDVPLKAMAAVSWCKTASSKNSKWEYLYVPQTIFSGFSSNKIEDLIRTCAPSLAELLTEKVKPQLTLPLGEYAEGKITGIDEFISSTQLEKLPSRYKKAIEQAVALFQFFEKKEEASFSPVFTSLLGPLDESAKGLISDLLLPVIPSVPAEQKYFFTPYYEGLNKGTIDWLKMNEKNLEKTLIFKNGLMPIGLLKFCLEYSQSDYTIGGIFEVIRQCFSRLNEADLYDTVKSIYDFRNTYIAHQDKELTDIKTTKEGLAHWVQGLYKIYMSHH